MKRSTLALFFVVLFAVLSVGTLVYAAGVPNTLGPNDVVQAIQGQVELLRWVGGAMVTGLVGAVAWLWRTLREEQGETRRIADNNARSNDKLADAVVALHYELKQRPCLKRGE